VQEDAFITFRSARHLAEQGDFSFNLHQHFPGTTSILYPLIVAGLDLLFHGWMVPAVQLFGTLCVALACYLAARAFSKDGGQTLAIWLLLACWPISLVVSYTGMETPLLLLALGAAICALAREGHSALFAVAILAMPLIRPDAVAYALIFCAAMLLIDRHQAIRGWAALFAGVGLLLIGERITTGNFLPTTSRAKEIAYHPDHSLAAIAGRVGDLFLHQSFLLPVSTSYLTRFAPAVLVIAIAAYGFAWRAAKSHRERVLVGALALTTIAVPLAYAAGGVLFDWYLFPANWVAMAVVLGMLARLIASVHPGSLRRVGWACVACTWMALAALQWTRSLAESTEDYHYRGDIGRYLGTISHGRGTLFLEPAGYIPTYSGLYTDDEVGLVSPVITGYILRDPKPASGAWWIAYVESEQPDYIVQREPFLHFTTFEGYTLTRAQQQWFNAHYRLLRRTHYEPWVYHPSPLLRRILALGKVEDYLVYARRDLKTVP
jgi:hypothetical protein